MLFHQAGFLEVFHGAWMHGRGKSFKHVFLGQRCISRVKLFEIFEIIKNFLGDGIDNLIRHLGAGYQGSLDAKGLNVLVILGAGIEFVRNGCLGIVGILGQQLVNAGT